MPINMPGYRHLNIAQEGFQGVADAALQFIEKSREEARRDKAYQQLGQYFGEYAKPEAQAPVQPASVQIPRQPEVQNGQAPQQLNPIQNVPQAVPINPNAIQNQDLQMPVQNREQQLLSMLQTNKVDPAQAFQMIQAMNQPQYKEVPYGGKMVRVYQDGRIEDVAVNPHLPAAQPKSAQPKRIKTDESGQPVTVGYGNRKNYVIQEFNPVTNSWQDSGVQEIGSTGSAGGAGMPDYNKPLSKQQQALVDKIGRYELNPQYLQGYRGADKNIIMAAVAEQYPGYNSMEYPIRAKAAADFRSPNGVAGRNVTAINTAIGHMGDMNKAAKSLLNADVPLWNKIKNVGLTQTGDPRVNNFLTAATAVEGEIAKVFAGKAGTDQEIAEWRNALNASQSPQQLQGAIQTLAHLLQSRIATLNWQAEQNVGVKIPLLSPRAKQTLQSIGINPDELENATETNHALTPGDIQEGDGGVKYRYKGGDQYDRKNWEQVK